MDNQVSGFVDSRKVLEFDNRLYDFVVKDSSKITKPFLLLLNYLKLIKRAFYIKKTIQKENPKFILFNTIGHFPNLPTILILNKMNIKNKLILTLHITNLKNDKAKLLEKITNYYLRKLIIKQRAKIILLGKYLNEKYLKKKDCFYLNYRNLENINSKKNDRVTFSVVGSGKNYQDIFDSFSNLKQDNFLINIFTRSSHDLKNLRKMLEKLKIKIKVKIFVNIDEKRLNMELSKSHYLLCPLKKIKGYGEFQITGNYADALSLKLPIILPIWYGGNFKFGKNVIKYKNLKESIDELIKLQDYHNRIADLMIERQKCNEDVKLFLNFIKG